METYVSRPVGMNMSILKLPFYPKSTGHYIVEKGWSTQETKDFTQFVSIVWMDSGEMECGLYGQNIIMHPGDVMIYYPGEERSRKVLSAHADFRWVTFDGPLAVAHIDAYGYDRYVRNAAKCPVDIFQQIASHISESDPFTVRMTISFIDQIIAHIGGKGDNLLPSGMYAKRFVEIVTTQFSDPALNVNTICDRIGCSRLRLARLFKAYSGDRTPGEFLMSTRIAEAGTLLRGTDLSVHEVARRCGIPNLNNFCRFFKRISGMTPLEFRYKRGID